MIKVKNGIVNCSGKSSEILEDVIMCLLHLYDNAKKQSSKKDADNMLKFILETTLNVIDEEENEIQS